MKATLIMEGVRATVDLDIEDAAQVVKAFIHSIANQLPDTTTQEKALAQAVAAPSEVITSIPRPSPPRTDPPAAPRDEVRTALFLIHCPDCGKTFPIRKPITFGSNGGEVVSCNCGSEIQVAVVKTASGTCGNCSARFWNLHVVNDLREIQCKQCQGIIDLFEKKDGTLTNAEGVKA